MKGSMKSGKFKMKGYALIIDKDGMPRIQNPLSVPDDVWNGLTEKQQTFANNRVSDEFKRIGE